MLQRTYNANFKTISSPSNKNFILHNHDFYEIYMFTKGDSSYVVEGNSYTLEPDDIIIIKKHEMHRVYHNSSAPYCRIVLEIYPEFFTKYHCEKYEFPFLTSGKNSGNKINASIVKSSGLKDAILRLKKYSDNFNNIDNPISSAIIIEILYIINGISTFSVEHIQNKHIFQVVSYINNNITENIKIEDLSDRFFISKYHLCRLFKSATGHTIHSYILQKRMMLVDELVSCGSNLSNAVIKSGFETYSSYYRSYKKIYGKSPRMK